MGALKYAAVRYPRRQVVPVRCDKETEHYVWVDGRKTAKKSEMVTYHDTAEEAATVMWNELEAKKANVEASLKFIAEEMCRYPWSHNPDA